MQVGGYTIKRVDERNIVVGKEITDKNGEKRINASMYFSDAFQALKWIRKQMINGKISYCDDVDGYIASITLIDKIFFDELKKQLEEVEELCLQKYQYDEFKKQLNEMKQKIKELKK